MSAVARRRAIRIAGMALAILVLFPWTPLVLAIVALWAWWSGQ